MLAKKFANPQLEETYDLIAEAIDKAGEAKQALFLAKLALALANMVGDPREVARAVEAALRDL